MRKSDCAEQTAQIARRYCTSEVTRGHRNLHGPEEDAGSRRQADLPVDDVRAVPGMRNM
jgi:hypothetical protein